MTQNTPSATDVPFVSVIMPVFNEAAFVGRSLSALLKQTYPRDRIEIIIADGMSTDNTRQVVSDTCSDGEIRIEILDNPGRIAPTGLNCAIARARGDIIVRVDGHCEIAPDYISNCVRLLKEQKADGVGGPIETVGDTPRAKAISLAMSSAFGVGGSAFRTINDREMYVDTVAFPGYTRSILEKAGKFDEELVRNQDDEYNYRIRKLGGKILLSPAIRSRYHSRSTFGSLWRQYFQYGYWKVRVLQLHPKQMSARQFVPFLFVITLLIAALLAIFSDVAKLLLLATIVLYLLANLTASIISALRDDLRLVPMLALSYGILHISYGLGFMKGLISFRDRWSR